MRTDDATRPIDPEHEAICSHYYALAIAGDDLESDDDLTTHWSDTASYARDLPDGRTLLVDIGRDGSHQAGVVG